MKRRAQEGRAAELGQRTGDRPWRERLGVFNGRAQSPQRPRWSVRPLATVSVPFEVSAPVGGVGGVVGMGGVEWGGVE